MGCIRHNSILLVLSISASAGLYSGMATSESDRDSAKIDRGRYIAKIAGCNDCHTPKYLISDGNVPVSEWLTGDVFGWHGPWGTTYGSNLRLFMAEMSEDEWVAEARSLKRRPPMPWFNLNAMAEEDLRALYQFTRSLGEPGEPAPAYLPPGKKPNPPFAIFPAPPKTAQLEQ